MNANANDLMNYGELSLTHATSEVDNASADALGLTLSTDFFENFFGGVTVTKGEATATYQTWGGEQTLSIDTKSSVFFVGGAYHLNSDTHLFGIVTTTNTEIEGDSDTSISYQNWR